jgi:hypothetical protein
VKALAAHPERARLLRTTVQYVEALRSWSPGREITCLAHLYMGVEALTKAVVREHLRRTGGSEDQLLIDWQVDRKRLDSEIRRRLIFQGDEHCFSKARAVSDGFEHGFTDFSEMRKLTFSAARNGPGAILRSSSTLRCRRRHQPRRPPLAKIRPGSPAPTTGPGTRSTSDRNRKSAVSLVMSPGIRAKMETSACKSPPFAPSPLALSRKKPGLVEASRIKWWRKQLDAIEAQL